MAYRIFVNPPEKKDAPICAYLTEKTKNALAVGCVFLPIVIIAIVSIIAEAR